MATPDIDFDADWLVLDGTEAVTYEPFDPATDTLDYPIPCEGMPFQVGKKEATGADEGTTLAVTRVWCLRASDLGGVQVTKRGEVVRGDDTRWRVISADLRAGGSHWRLDTVKVEG